MALQHGEPIPHYVRPGIPMPVPIPQSHTPILLSPIGDYAPEKIPRFDNHSGWGNPGREPVEGGWPRHGPASPLSLSRKGAPMSKNSHKVHCWCGIVTGPKCFHYPANDPENGPAHRATPPCPDCGHQPHSGPCFPPCNCADPRPRLYDDRDDANPDHWIVVCTGCGCEIEGLTPEYFDTEPETYSTTGLKSEHVPIALLRSSGHSNIGSALAVAVRRWINEQED